MTHTHGSTPHSLQAVCMLPFCGNVLVMNHFNYIRLSLHAYMYAAMCSFMYLFLYLSQESIYFYIYLKKHTHTLSRAHPLAPPPYPAKHVTAHALSPHPAPPSNSNLFNFRLNSYSSSYSSSLRALTLTPASTVSHSAHLPQPPSAAAITWLATPAPPPSPPPSRASRRCSG